MVFVSCFVFVVCPLYTIRMSEYLQIFFLPGFTPMKRETSSGRHRSARVIVMASGFGARGSEGRCAPAWREFSKVRRRRTNGCTRWNDGAMERRGERARVEAIFDRFWRPRRREKDRPIERTNERTNERFGMTTRCVRGESVTTTGTACCLRD